MSDCSGLLEELVIAVGTYHMNLSLKSSREFEFVSAVATSKTEDVDWGGMLFKISIKIVTDVSNWAVCKNLIHSIPIVLPTVPGMNFTLFFIPEFYF